MDEAAKKEAARTFVSRAAASLGWSKITFAQRIQDDHEFRRQVHIVMSMRTRPESVPMHAYVCLCMPMHA
jgi:hypothetical protein